MGFPPIKRRLKNTSDEWPSATSNKSTNLSVYNGSSLVLRPPSFKCYLPLSSAFLSALNTQVLTIPHGTKLLPSSTSEHSMVPSG